MVLLIFTVTKVSKWRIYSLSVTLFNLGLFLFLKTFATGPIDNLQVYVNSFNLRSLYSENVNVECCGWGHSNSLST